MSADGQWVPTDISLSFNWSATDRAKSQVALLTGPTAPGRARSAVGFWQTRKNQPGGLDRSLVLRWEIRVCPGCRGFFCLRPDRA